jgi:hypothetical protein
MTITSALRAIAWMGLALGLLLWGRAARAQCPIPAEDFTPDPEFSSSFMFERCKFETTGDNPFFPLRPGWQVRLESDEEVATITVLDETRKVNGVRTRVVEEFESERDGDELVPVERSLNFMAYCKQTGSIAYFGEEVFFFDDEGDPIPGTGGWLDGQNGARAGLIMPGTILVGGGYYQEIAPEDSALDKGRIVALEESCEVGDFEFDEQCVQIVDTSDCDPDSEDLKVFAAGIGNVVDEDLEVTSFGFVDDDDGDDDDRHGGRTRRHGRHDDD